MSSNSDPLEERGSWYRRQGLTPLINAKGTYTTLGGSLLHPSVTDAMSKAGRAFVSLDEMNEWAGEVIAKHTGAEAGFPTSGAAAGMTLQAAACIAGDDPSAVPVRSDSDRPEIVVKRHHENPFVRMWEDVGASIVWVGDEDGATDSEVEAAITSRTVALGFIASRTAPDSFSGVDSFASIADDNDLPFIVDAAAMLPPPSNLSAFIDHGADLVTISGGKALGGPQSTGILAGRSDLVSAAKAHNSPRHALNRGAKVCKEEIAGLIAALRRYVSLDHEAIANRWWNDCEVVRNSITQMDGIDADIRQDDWTRPVPCTLIRFAERWDGPTPSVVRERLLAGSPAIAVDEARPDDADLCINPHCLEPGEVDIVADRLTTVLSG